VYSILHNLLVLGSSIYSKKANKILTATFLKWLPLPWWKQVYISRYYPKLYSS